MSKFRVGDKVVINGYGYIDRNGIVTWVGDNGIMVDSGLSLGEHEQNSDQSEFHLYFSKSEASLATTNTLQVGKTYTSENGDKWECIFIRGGKAWLIGVYSDAASGSAFEFDIDGTASWAGYGADDYNIKWGPKRETVTTRFSIGVSNKDALDGVDNYVANITFDLIYGTPDWTTAKVSPCD